MRIVILGPQRFEPNVAEAMSALGVRTRVAAVTAGWQERESEVDELTAHLDCDIAQLELYRRFDEVLAEDQELSAALRGRQQRLHRLQNLYRRRLAHHLAMVRELLADTGDDDLLDPERRDAIDDVRALDAHHLDQVRGVHDQFDRRWEPSSREAVARQRGEIAELVARCDALVIAGGHVAVLLNRLRLFDLVPMLEHTPVVAWSAGAMTLAECIVLFHDSPPQGPGNPEILEAGLGLCPGIIPLPHARNRLRLDDPLRVTMFSLRFAPSRSVVLEQGSRLDWDGQGWNAAPGTTWLGPEGTLETVGDA